MNPTKEKNMDTELNLTETADDLVAAILDEHERELADTDQFGDEEGR